MKLSEFDYVLPHELIAQFPSTDRGDDRLLVVEKGGKTFSDKTFGDITAYFKKGDLLILNDTKVIPARLYGHRASGGKVEIFVVDKTKRPVEALVRPSGRIKDGEEIALESGDKVVIRGYTDIGRLVDLGDDPDEILSRAGHVPLPPYIARADEELDRSRYQTVFAANEGATAAPTAGLHFTKEIIDGLKERGVNVAYVTLHTSFGTFAPIKTENVEDHKMHSEYYRIDKDSIIAIKAAKDNGNRVFACGTTSVRVLESRADEIINFIPQEDNFTGESSRYIDGYTDFFIYPGYKFRMVDALITNFHLPKSTLLLLTSALAGKELLFEAYRHAVKDKYRFFSYGDAMLIV